MSRASRARAAAPAAVVLLLVLVALPLPGTLASAAAADGSVSAVRVSSSPGWSAEGDCSGDQEAESEPVVAVDPRDERRRIAAWVQGAERAVMTSVSGDRGRTWSTASPVPGLTRCTGGDLPYVSHPTVAFAPDGSAYLAVFARDLPLGAAARTLVSRSSDGGVTWQLTSRPDAPPVDLLNDYDSFAVEPDSGALLVLWTPAEAAVAAELTVLSRSTDEGRTWTRTAVRTTAGGVAAWSRLVALPDGRLHVVAVDTPLVDAVSVAPVPGRAVWLSSGDHGRTWSAPVDLGPASGFHWPAVSAGPGGDVHVAWVQSQPGGSCRRLSPDSTSGGSCQVVERHLAPSTGWSPATPVTRWRGPFMPTPGLAVDGHGVVTAVVTRPRDDSGTVADVIVSTRRPGRPWQARPGGTVDLAVLASSGPGLGLYQGAAGSRCGVTGAAVRTEGAVDGRTDVFLLRTGCDAGTAAIA